MKTTQKTQPTQTVATRRDFLKTSMLTALGLGAASSGLLRLKAVPATPALRSTGDISATRPRPTGNKPVYDLTTQPLAKVRVAIIGLGGRGTSVLNNILNVEFAEVTALCDILPDKVDRALKAAKTKRGFTPRAYSGSDSIWEKLVEQDNIDVVYVDTPWEWHVPMCEKAMLAGKHAFVEVAAALTVDECWRLVDISEKTQRHCPIMENCCYGEEELFVLNLTRNNVFGDLTHAECAYLHNMRANLFWLGKEGAWRREYHKTLDGNLYPTHGLGPVCQYMNIGRGDNMKHLVSMSSREAGLTQYLAEHNPNNGQHAGEKYICGDMNTSLIKTEQGRTIMVQHDVVGSRPYSRINALYGVHATYFDYPPRLALDTPAAYGLTAKDSDDWLNEKDMKKMRDKFTHPLWKQLQTRAKGSGHGGMDFVINYRMLDCLRQGITPDMTVYDAAAWSSILELSVKSVASGSAPQPIPDFTRGAWKTIKPLGIVTA